MYGGLRPPRGSKVESDPPQLFPLDVQSRISGPLMAFIDGLSPTCNHSLAAHVAPLPRAWRAMSRGRSG